MEQEEHGNRGEPEETIRIVGRDRSLGSVYRSVLGLNRWAPRSLLLCGAVAFFGLLLAVMDQSDDGKSWWPFVVGVGAGTAVLLFQQFRMAQSLHSKGCASSRATFVATPSRIRYEMPEGSSELSWSAVDSLCVSSHTIYVFVDRSRAWLMPRGSHDERVLALARAAGARIRGA